jgi:tRNA pseudouridine55 synthase
MQGVLLVDKPSGWTSFDAVNYVRKIVARAEGKKPKNVKVGHTGTLDPLATGLLVLLIGKDYTRRASELAKLDKTYELEMKLGATSSTGDSEGALAAASERVPTASELAVALAKFTGEIMQTPPAYSAIKVNGQRAYKLARAGKAVELAPRPVTIHELTLASYNYPLVALTASVSSGTYIRSLAEDIGETLATGAYLTKLRRTRIGKFQLTEASQLKDENLLQKITQLKANWDGR